MQTPVAIPLWHAFEHTFASARSYENPAQDVRLSVTLYAPSGRVYDVDGFWDGGETWRVRFAPDEPGSWSFASQCSDQSNPGLHSQGGSFVCAGPAGDTRFERHGPPRVAEGGRCLEHADGTPFLWLSDTAWNGPLRSSEGDWDAYLAARAEQQFSAVQWVATQWRAAPDGDLEGRVAYQGRERIAIDPHFFQRLDRKVDRMRAAGLLPAPVLLWTVGSSTPDEQSVDPGRSLPEDQAILLARHMVARWGAGPVLWILNGDGNYAGERALRWRRIGEGVFGGRAHTPVAIHPCGMHLPIDEFRDCSWLDVIGYQSGHGDRAETQRWLTSGPPATAWVGGPPRPFVNLEPPYEDHVGYHSGRRLEADVVRRALWWSLLIAPTAGVSYGGHGVWGWDDGTAPPVGHANSGIPRPWRAALHLPAAEQLRHIAALFGQIDWWRLRPAPELLAQQPGDADPARFVAAAAAPSGDLALVYAPAGARIALQAGSIAGLQSARWFDPRAGTSQPASGQSGEFMAPDGGDWVLVLQP
jgi:hypothetical protein